jgi:hypothetical protein
MRKITPSAVLTVSEYSHPSISGKADTGVLSVRPAFPSFLEANVRTKGASTTKPAIVIEDEAKVAFPYPI